MKKILWILAPALALMGGCASKHNGESGYVNNITLYLGDKSKPVNGHAFNLDYTHTIYEGFVFPSARQSPDGLLHVDIDVSNLDPDKKYFYKVFYQNESYKFDELNDDDELVSENFYGSWEDTEKGFLPVDAAVIENGEGTISTALRVVGNPRNEDIYFDNPDFILNEDSIAKKIEVMRHTPEWMESIAQKAKDNKVALEEQMRLDAIYMLEYTFKQHGTREKKNVRSGRNLRTGDYSVMVVLADSDQLAAIPSYIQSIGRAHHYRYYNPYTYFCKSETYAGKKDDATKARAMMKLDKAFTLKAKLALENGIYFDDKDYGPDYPKTAFSKTCNKNGDLYARAQLEQFIHTIYKDALLENIPVIADVVGDNYSPEEYAENSLKYPAAKRVKQPISITDCPCKTVITDTIAKTVKIVNPASTRNKMRKENVGVITRHGFTYGKYTIKIKMAEQMNRHNIWNGLTNAIWLINRAGVGNKRRVCESGYIPKETYGQNPKREKQLGYSEIDFEIVKCAQFWPKSSYPVQSLYRPEDTAGNKANVMVTCTNWDMACADVDDYIVGSAFRKLDNHKAYEMHRWDTWYKALTIKTPAVEDELFAADYYYFQIDWKPHNITWRIGPEKDKLTEVGYMNDIITNIPNNQMLLAITQEYHLANWWPEAPFSQNDVPFPAKPHEGIIYSIEIE